MRLLIAFLLLAALLTPAWAQNGGACSDKIRGTYSVVCSGFMSPAAGAPQVPMSMLGTVAGDFLGNFTGGGKVSLGGTIVDQTVTGTVNWTGNCTGSISYTQKIAGQPAPSFNIVFNVLNEGKEMRGMAVDAGATVSCHLVLMSR